MPSKHTAKPRGWGSMAFPTGNGSRRVQFMLRASDLDLLESHAKSWGCANRAEAVRESLKRSARLPAEKVVRPVVSDYVSSAKESRKGREVMVRWSQWMRPEDFDNVNRLRGWMGLANLAEVVRFAVRAARVADTPPPPPVRMPPPERRRAR